MILETGDLSLDRESKGTVRIVKMGIRRMLAVLQVEGTELPFILAVVGTISGCFCFVVFAATDDH